MTFVCLHFNCHIVLILVCDVMVYAMNVINWNVEEINKMEVIQNKVGRLGFALESRYQEQKFYLALNFIKQE